MLEKQLLIYLAIEIKINLILINTTISEFNNDQSFNKSVFNINSDTDNNTERLFDLSSSNN